MTTPRIVSDWLACENTQAIFRVLAEGGFVARAVGGAVRNTLLERPVSDIDIATTATPADVVRLARAAGLHVVETGLKHGTVTVISNHVPFEVTTLREDVSTDGRHAEVAFTDDWVADASRRDFTINALYCDPDGQVFDPLGGLEDLAQRRVRFIGDPHARIREDYLRILRFFRFFAQYAAGAPDAEGLAACVQERRGLRRLSAERLRQEFSKLVCAPRAEAAIGAMLDHGLVTGILRSAPSPHLFRRVIALDGEGDWALRLAALAVHATEDAARLGRVLSLSNAERTVLSEAGSATRRPLDVHDETALRRLLYSLGAQAYRRRVLLARAERTMTHEDDDTGFAHAISLPERWQVPAFPIAGADVLALGVPAGPRVGEFLRTLEAEWIARDFARERVALLERLKQVVNHTPDPTEQ